MRRAFRAARTFIFFSVFSVFSVAKFFSLSVRTESRILRRRNPGSPAHGCAGKFSHGEHGEHGGIQGSRGRVASAGVTRCAGPFALARTINSFSVFSVSSVAKFFSLSVRTESRILRRRNPGSPALGCAGKFSHGEHREHGGIQGLRGRVAGAGVTGCAGPSALPVQSNSSPCSLCSPWLNDSACQYAQNPG
jgi:hypothetical protein